MSGQVLIISDDAADLAALVDDDIPVDLATDARDARAAYDGHPILFGTPAAIAEILQDMPAVQWVQSTWAGVTPLLELGRRDYVLTGIKDVFGPQMSEYVLGHLLAHELKIDQRRKEQLARRWYDEPSGTLAGKRMGVMGTGSIGQAIARQATAFGIEVSGLSRTGHAVDGFAEVISVDRIDEFLPALDYLVGVLPDTSSTNGLLNAESLALLPSHAVFVNVGRSNVVDDEALVNALAGGTLGGAILDVFDEEPVPQESALWDAPNLVITAHIAAISHPELIVPVFVDNYRRFSSGQQLLHVIDFEQGY